MEIYNLESMVALEHALAVKQTITENENTAITVAEQSVDLAGWCQLCALKPKTDHV